MSLRRLNPFQKRISEYESLLALIARQDMPWTCEAICDIEKLLALHSAGLLNVEFDAPVVGLDRAKHIPRAVVLGLTAEGRATLRKALPGSNRQFALPV